MANRANVWNRERLKDEEMKRKSVNTFRSLTDVFNDKVNKNGVYSSDLFRNNGSKQK